MAVWTEFVEGLYQASVGDIVMQSGEAILLSIEEEDDVVRLFQADQLCLLAESCTVGQPIPQKTHLFFFLLPVYKNWLMP